MGDGLKRVAAQCGGLTVTDKSGTVHYDAQGQVRKPRTIADSLADYKTTPESAKSLIRRLLDKLIDLRCPHCGRSVPVTIESETYNDQPPITMSEEAWKPLDRHVTYVCAILESTCWLWEGDPEQSKVIAAVAGKKLQSVWQLVWQSLPAPHQQLCANLFWDAVVTQYSRKPIYMVEAVFGEVLNPNGDARSIIIRVRPTHCAEIIQFALNA